MPLSYNTNDPLSAAQEAAMGRAMSAYMDLPDTDKARITAECRRQDCARFASRLAHWTQAEAARSCHEHRREVRYYTAALAQAEREEADALRALAALTMARAA